MIFASSGLCRKRLSACTFCGFFVASQVKSIQGQNMLNSFFCRGNITVTLEQGSVTTIPLFEHL